MTRFAVSLIIDVESEGIITSETMVRAWRELTSAVVDGVTIVDVEATVIDERAR